MRLIDADVLMKAFYKSIDDAVLHGGKIVPFQDIIQNAPTIDAVPVVRCKDCRWWDNSEDSPYGYCMAMKHGYMSENWEIGIYRRYKGDFYCADAERKEDE